MLFGYYINDTVIKNVENVLLSMKEKIVNAARENVKKQVGREITCITDDITLNRIPRPNNISILDMAKGMVLKRINFAKNTGCATEFNYLVYGCIMTYEDRTYIRLDTNNNIYINALHDVPGLCPFHIYESKLDKTDSASHVKIWNEIRKKYENTGICRYVNFISSETELFDGQIYSDIVFESIRRRAEKLARHEAYSKLINMYAFNEQMPQFKMYEYFDWAIEHINSNIWKDSVDEDYLKLCDILIEITPEVFEMIPNSETGTDTIK